MQTIRTYHHYWILLFTLLLSWTTWTSVYSQGRCACAPIPVVDVPTPTASNSCCHASKEATPLQPQATHCKAPTAPTEWQGCCCDDLPQWMALQQLPEIPGGAVCALVPVSPFQTALPHWNRWASPFPAPQTAALFPPYRPPLLHRDVPILVQSFLC